MAKKWQDDLAYQQEIADLLEAPAVQATKDHTHHLHTTRLDHSLQVSYLSYRIAKRLRLNTRATARGGLLHDLFYYDWRTTKFKSGSHAYVHPRIALRNAEKLTPLSDMEKDIIIKHMWGATWSFPRYCESYVVALVDTYLAIVELVTLRRNHRQ